MGARKHPWCRKSSATSQVSSRIRAFKNPYFGGKWSPFPQRSRLQLAYGTKEAAEIVGRFASQEGVHEHLAKVLEPDLGRPLASQRNGLA